MRTEGERNKENGNENENEKENVSFGGSKSLKSQGSEISFFLFSSFSVLG